MKNVVLTILLLCAGCAAAHDDFDEKLKSPEVNQVAFTGDGKYLVAANYPINFSDRKKTFSRLRSFSTADWKAAADSGELSLTNFAFAPCSGKSWLIQANEFYRTGGGNPMGGILVFQFDPVTLKRTPLDVFQRTRLDAHRGYKASAVACADNKPLCARHLVSSTGGLRSDYPPFLFDLKANKKTAVLQDYPTGERAGEFMRTALVFSPDGTHLVSCQPIQPFRLQLHTADTGKLVKEIKLDSPAGALRFSPDGKRLAAHCWNGEVLILEPDLSKQTRKLRVRMHNADWKYMPNGLAFAGNERLAVVASSHKVELFDTKEGKSIHSFTDEKTPANCVAASPDGKRLAVGYGQAMVSPGEIRVFEVPTGKLLAKVQ